MRKPGTFVIRAAGEPERVRVIERLDNGGGIIEIPLAVETPGVILQNTASAAQGTLDVTGAMFAEMVSNFDKNPGPVPVYFGHENRQRRPETARKADTPAAGNITRIWVEGDQLWGRMTVGPKAFRLVVEESGFFGFSIEADFNPDKATGMIEGWVLEGGVFTNDPAFNVNFIAAERNGSVRALCLTLPLDAAEGETMTKEEQAEMERLKAANAKLEAAAKDAPKSEDLDRLRAENEKLKATAEDKSKAADKSATELKAANDRITALEDRDTEREVRSIVRAAIQDGKPPAFFESEDTPWEDKPVEFLKARFGGSLDSLRASVAALKAVPLGQRDVETGTAVEGGGAGEDKVDAAIRKLQAEDPKLDYNTALDHVRRTQPDLWRVHAENYRKAAPASPGT